MTSKNIFGSWYYLDQDWEEGDEEKVSILSDSDGDFYYELTLPDGMEGDEAIAFLFLDFQIIVLQIFQSFDLKFNYLYKVILPK